MTFLIDDARHWWRFWSIQFLLAGLAVDAGGLLWLIGLMPPPIRDVVPLIVIDVTKIVLFALAGITRFIPQTKLAEFRKKMEAERDAQT